MPNRPLDELDSLVKELYRGAGDRKLLSSDVLALSNDEHHIDEILALMPMCTEFGFSL
jgi:hypothetical protein